MRLKVGQLAPAFRLPEISGEVREFVPGAGGLHWIAFFRYASCPLCNLRVHQLITEWARWEARGLTMWAIFQSSPKTMQTYVGRQNPPFTLLCDPEERIYRRFGLESSVRGFWAPSNASKLARAGALGFVPGTMEGTKTRLPADFLIDTRGRVQTAFYATTISEHLDFDQVDKFLDSFVDC